MADEVRVPKTRYVDNDFAAICERVYHTFGMRKYLSEEKAAEGLPRKARFEFYIYYGEATPSEHIEMSDADLQAMKELFWAKVEETTRRAVGSFWSFAQKFKVRYAQEEELDDLIKCVSVIFNWKFMAANYEGNQNTSASLAIESADKAAVENLRKAYSVQLTSAKGVEGWICERHPIFVLLDALKPWERNWKHWNTSGYYTKRDRLKSSITEALEKLYEANQKIEEILSSSDRSRWSDLRQLVDHTMQRMLSAVFMPDHPKYKVLHKILEDEIKKEIGHTWTETVEAIGLAVAVVAVVLVTGGLGATTAALVVDVVAACAGVAEAVLKIDDSQTGSVINYASRLDQARKYAPDFEDPLMSAIFAVMNLTVIARFKNVQGLRRWAKEKAGPPIHLRQDPTVAEQLKKIDDEARAARLRGDDQRANALVQSKGWVEKELGQLTTEAERARQAQSALRSANQNIEEINRKFGGMSPEDVYARMKGARDATKAADELAERQLKGARKTVARLDKKSKTKKGLSPEETKELNEANASLPSLLETKQKTGTAAAAASRDLQELQSMTRQVSADNFKVNEVVQAYRDKANLYESGGMAASDSYRKRPFAKGGEEYQYKAVTAYSAQSEKEFAEAAMSHFRGATANFEGDILEFAVGASIEQIKGFKMSVNWLGGPTRYKVRVTFYDVFPKDWKAFDEALDEKMKRLLRSSADERLKAGVYRDGLTKGMSEQEIKAWVDQRFPTFLSHFEVTTMTRSEAARIVGSIEDRALGAAARGVVHGANALEGSGNLIGDRQTVDRGLASGH